MIEHSKLIELISALFPETKISGIEYLSPFISKIVFRKNGSEKIGSIVVSVSGTEYETVEKFLAENGVVLTQELKLIIEQICTYDKFGIDISNMKNSISLYFEEKNNSRFIPKSYKKMIPNDATEDGIKVTYDLNKNRIVYLKAYCVFKEKLITDRKNSLRNFGFLVNSNGSVSATVSQACAHKNIRNIEEVENNLRDEYETIKNLGFKCYISATREESGQSYLYIKRSL
jgi:hypothetical protein